MSENRGGVGILTASNGGEGDHANETTSDGTDQGTDLRTRRSLCGGRSTRGSRRERRSANGRINDAASDWDRCRCGLHIKLKKKKTGGGR